jgi:hypothetical protein
VATAASTLIQRTRRFLKDWPDGDKLTAAVSDTTTTSLTVADASTAVYSPSWIIQIDQEAMRVVSGTGTTLTVRRGALGTTAATHSNGAQILIRPGWVDQEILDALNAALNATFPLLYIPVADTSLTADAATYEFTVPQMASPVMYIPRLSRIDLKRTGDAAYRKVVDWELRRGDTPKIKFRFPPDTGTLRVNGYGPFPNFTTSADTLHALFPGNLEDALVDYAAQHLIASGEAARVRQDTGARDDREAANRPGSAMAAANAILARFQQRVQQSAMPPMEPHIVPVY